MPQKTFFNLSPERQTEIRNVCFAEFAHKDYTSASLARIIKKLGLAKGSFYRYFENKADLYRYLYKTAYEILISKSKQLFTDPEKDFFSEWLGFIDITLELEKENPHYLRFLKKAGEDLKARELGLTGKQGLESRLKHTAGLIQHHQAGGTIRKDIPVEILSFFVVYIRDAMRQYFLLKEQPAGETGIDAAAGDEQIKAELAFFITCMKNGIGSPGK